MRRSRRAPEGYGLAGCRGGPSGPLESDSQVAERARDPTDGFGERRVGFLEVAHRLRGPVEQRRLRPGAFFWAAVQRRLDVVEQLDELRTRRVVRRRRVLQQPVDLFERAAQLRFGHLFPQVGPDLPDRSLPRIAW